MSGPTAPQKLFLSWLSGRNGGSADALSATSGAELQTTNHQPIAREARCRLPDARDESRLDFLELLCCVLTNPALVFLPNELSASVAQDDAHCELGASLVVVSDVAQVSDFWHGSGFWLMHW
jgi:hypothetical protein